MKGLSDEVQLLQKILKFIRAYPKLLYSQGGEMACTVRNGFSNKGCLSFNL